MPASTRARSWVGDEVLGPIVQTILARRMRQPYGCCDVGHHGGSPSGTSPRSTEQSSSAVDTSGCRTPWAAGRTAARCGQTVSGRSVGRDRARQRARAGEPRVDAGGGGTALGDGPDDERLPTTGVAGDEDARDRAHEVLVAPDVAALVELDAELLDDARALRAEEAHREEDELGGDLALGAGLGAQPAVDELDLGETQGRDVAVVVADELGRAHGVDPLAALLVGARDAVEHRVGRPRLGARGGPPPAAA